MRKILDKVKPRVKSIWPGFGLSLSISLVWLVIFLLVPILALVLQVLPLGLDGILRIACTEDAVSAYLTTLGYSFFAALTNAIFGTLLAWVLFRYKFLGRSLFQILIDVPLALPGAIGGIALASVYATNGALGFLSQLVGFNLIYSPSGIYIALLYAGLPYVVHAVQAQLEILPVVEEEAAKLLGASRLRYFWTLVFPSLIPGIVSGAIMAFARGIGEYGTVIFVSSNIPSSSEVISRHLYNYLEAYDIAGASVIALVSLLLAVIALGLAWILAVWNKTRSASLVP